METKREVDPLMSPEALRPRVADYTAGQDAALGLISPVFADLSGLPPLIIQAESPRLPRLDGVPVEVSRHRRDQALHDLSGAPHVFQAYYPILDEAAAALDRAGQFLSAQLAAAERAPPRASVTVPAEPPDDAEAQTEE